MIPLEPSRQQREEARQKAAHLLASLPRQRILSVLRERPGLPLGELRELVGIPWATLHHHLTRLEQAGLARTLTQGRRRLAYPTGAEEAPEAGRARAMLAGRAARQAALAVAQRPGGGVADVARAAGLSARAAYYHVRRLVDGGLVETATPGRLDALRPTPLLVQVLDLGAAPPDTGGEKQ